MDELRALVFDDMENMDQQMLQLQDVLELMGYGAEVFPNKDMMANVFGHVRGSIGDIRAKLDDIRSAMANMMTLNTAG